MALQTTTHQLIDHIIRLFHHKGLRNVVVSPGSRNAPIVIALESIPEINKFVVTDERSAAFIAMGIAQQTNMPTAVVCTSGSAVLNYAPAVAEAFYQNIPLLVLSADRPSEWTDQGDGQTIRQLGSLEPHVAKSFQIDTQKGSQWNANRLANEAWELALNSKSPVHINLPLNEPLYDKCAVSEQEIRTFELIEVEKAFSQNTLSTFKEQWDNSSKKMILIGQMTENHKVRKYIEQLADDPSVCILTENIANIGNPKIVRCIDRTLAAIKEQEIEKFQPDFLITLGGAVVSKKIKNFLRNASINYHWRVGEHNVFMDTYCQMTHSIPLEEGTFLEQIIDTIDRKLDNRFGLQWKQLDFQTQDKHHQFIQSAPFSDLKAFYTLLDLLPEMSVLHLANSSVVRYAQLFDAIPSVKYYGNRGTSGIDGSTSTAVGHAIADPDNCHTIITGDLSFFYDSNALWNHHLPSNLRIVLINNSGGDIFKIIDGPTKTGIDEKYFHVTHNFNAESLCKNYNVNYYPSSNEEDISSQMISFYEINDNERPALMEIHTPTNVNSDILKEYFKSLV